MGMIRAEKLVFEYDKRDEDGNVIGSRRAIDGVDIDIPQGSFVAVLGHNGSGKSTLAKHMNAILVPTDGTMWVDGKDTKDMEKLWEIRQSAGMVFQNPDNQIIGTVVEEDVGFGPENLGVPTKEIWKRVEDSLRAVGMLDRRKDSPNKLSGGQKQRVAIAGVIAMEPKCIVLDEPTSFLDIRYKLEFMSVLQELARRKKVAVILSIHELDLAERVSDWVLCVSPGQESQFGRPEEMLTPEHLSELFQVEEGRFRQTGGSMELPRPEGAPEVFVLAGGGSGRAVFWQLQRAGTTFAAGIVSEADLDYPAACTLASRLIAVPAFEEISEEKEQEARECLDACQCVIACRRQYGGWAAANDRLLAYAREKGKKIEYHNLPLHKMQ